MKLTENKTAFETPEAIKEKKTLLRFFENAPKTEGNPDIVGYWTKRGWFVCTHCGASILARGCSLPVESYIWVGDGKPYGICVCCNDKKEE